MIIDQTDPPPLIDLADLKTRVDLIDVAQALRLEGLKKQGANYVARCPAHKDEGRPNLVLWPKVNGVKCYQCGWSADVIGLVAKVNGVDAGEAIRWLADRAGMSPMGDKAGRRKKSTRDPFDVDPKGAPLPAAKPAAATTPARPAAGRPDQVAPKADQLVRPVTTAQAQPAKAFTPPPFLTPPSIVDATLTAEELKAVVGELVSLTSTAAEGRYQVKYRPGRLGLRICWPADSPVAVIGDFWGRRADGRLVADYTPEELAWALIVAGRDVTADQVREEYAGRLHWLPSWPTPAVMSADMAQADQADAGAPKPPSLRALVYEALLGHVKPPPSEGAIWLRDRKGISFETQTAAGIGWLDWEAADRDLRATFGDAVLAGFGLMSLDKKTGQPIALRFKNHRLVFPFWIPTAAGGRAAVYLQARNIHADHEGRFLRPGEATPSPYNVAAINAARAAGEEVFITEGESDCLTLTQLGKHAVGIVGSTGFKPEWARLFEGLRVLVTQDADEAGERFAKAVAQAFTAAGLEAPRVIKLPAGQDVTDLFTGKKSKKTATADAGAPVVNSEDLL